MVSSRLWIRVQRGWQRADQIVGVHSGKTGRSGSTYAVWVQLPVSDGVGDGDFGPYQATFAKATSEDDARRIGQELVRLLTTSGENASGIVEFRDDKISITT